MTGLRSDQMGKLTSFPEPLYVFKRMRGGNGREEGEPKGEEGAARN